jgi:uncharacterized membrane protein YjfL (UPF0719 family)
MSALLISLTAVVSLFPYFLFGLILFFLGKFLFDISTPRIEDDKELTERDNPAFGVFFTGYMLGLGFAIAGSFYGLGPSVVDNLVNIGTSGIAAIILLRISMIIADRLILYSFRIDKEIIQDRNVGTGFAVGGIFVASGLIIEGVMTGQSASYLEMLRDILIYWAVGQVFLVIAGLLFQVMARYNVHKTIEEDDNMAAGISMGGYFVGLGIILKAALTGAGSDLGPELLVTVVIGIVGLIVLVFARFLADVVLLPRASLADEVSRQKNTAAGAVSAVAFIAIAVLFSTIITTQIH